MMPENVQHLSASVYTSGKVEVSVLLVIKIIVQQKWWHQRLRHRIYMHQNPSKDALARSSKKMSFFLAFRKILWDLVNSWGILRNLVGFCRNPAGIFHNIPARVLQNPTRSCKIFCKISKDLAAMQEKRTFSWKTLQEHFYWDEWFYVWLCNHTSWLLILYNLLLLQ